MSKIIASYLRIILPIFIIFTFYGYSFSAVDIKESYDTDIKTFGNCKVSVVNKKNGKKLIFIEIPISHKQFFRIVFNKYNVLGFMDVLSISIDGMNEANKYRNIQNERGYTNIFIGDRQYNVETGMSIEGQYYICFYKMPNGFINLLKENNQFTIDMGGNNLVLMPVSLKGFPEALRYVEQLQKRL